MGDRSGMGCAKSQSRRARTFLPNPCTVRHAQSSCTSKIRERLGDSLTTIVSGGAALNDHTARFFWALGIEVVEGWGLSESCAPATLNTDGIRNLGSVGKAMPSVEMKLSKHSEILLKGAGIFSGYYGIDSSDAFDDDGYFKTGDLGFVDSDGHLTITGRSKDILVTAGGKNIAPRRIESKVDGELIHHCIVVGSEQPYLVALIALDDEFLMNLAAENDWSGDFATLSQLSECQADGRTNVCRPPMPRSPHLSR